MLNVMVRILQLDIDALDDTDIRKVVPFPRFQKENLPNIQRLVDTLAAIGQRHDATPAQVSLAWLLAQGDNVIPIPGTTAPSVRLS